MPISVNRNYSIHLFSFLILAIFFSGCASLSGGERAIIKDSGRPVPVVINSLRASATVRMIDIKNKEVKGRAAILVERPNRFRIEIFGPFGQAAAVMVSDGHLLSVSSGGTTRYYSAQEGTLYIFTPEELTDFLLGMRGCAREESTDSIGSAIDYMVTRDNMGCVTRFTRELKNGQQLLAKIGDYRDQADGSRFPFSLSVESEIDKLYIRYRSVELHPAIDDGFFRHPEEGRQRP